MMADESPIDLLPPTIVTNYKPTGQAYAFHESLARFRYLIWGIKSGKSHAGALEMVRACIGLPGGSWAWVVGPTYLHLDTAEREFENIFKEILRVTGVELVQKRNRSTRKWILKGGTRIDFKSGEHPDHLRGPNLDMIWIDEGGYLSDEAWHITRSRTAATEGEIIVTTTPPPTRTWLWTECMMAGMPPDMDYGTFSTTRENNYDNRFVSHYPTWDFPWVSKEELADEKASLPRAVFDREYGALFVTSESRVFPALYDALSMEMPPRKKVMSCVMGLDLAKMQDYTAVVIMDANRRVHHVQRWNKESWILTRARIVELAREWNSAIVLDRANVGSVIEEDLAAELVNDGLQVIPMDMNSAMVKMELIQSLQMAFEQKRIQIPNPKALWAPEACEQLVKELNWYEFKLTRGGRIGYSAPRGLNDDMVVALALANHGCSSGAAGGVDPATVSVAKEDWDKIKTKGPARRPRPRIYARMFGRGSWGGDYNGPIWG